MTDKIEKKEATFAVPYNGEDNNDYVDDEVVQHIEYVPLLCLLQCDKIGNGNDRIRKHGK